MTEPRKQGDLWMTVLFGLLLLMGFGLVALGVVEYKQERGFTVLALGAVGLIVAASAAAIAIRPPSAGGGGGGQEQLLRAILDRLSLSDLERRMIDRQRDRENLRKAILDDIAKQDFEAALALVDQMVGEFGYREEAEQYRQQIIDARSRRQEQQIDEAISKVDTMCNAYDWDRALREVERLNRLYPDVARVTALPVRIQQAKDNHKRELERDFLKAAEAGDTDKAMALLKELDLYLTPAEADQYKEVARGVVGQARENLGVRFQMAIGDRDWVSALSVGEQIIRDFPNSKMADEVRERIDLLRERAQGQKTAEAGRSIY